MEHNNEEDKNVCGKEHSENIIEETSEKEGISPMSNIKKGANLFAEHLAKEAKQKASEIISKNDRVQQEFSGIGININQQNTLENDYLNINEENCVCINEYGNNNENEENEETLTMDNPKKKFLIGARAVMPTGDKELLEKLKQRRA